MAKHDGTEALSTLVQELVQRIDREGPLGFDAFMEQALYHPRFGYYASGRVRLGGPGADFRTAPEMHPAFAEMLAVQAIEMDRALGEPDPFRLVELGPGTGRLAHDLLAAAHAVAPGATRRWEYRLVERSPALVELQRRTLSDLPGALQGVVDWSTFDELARRPREGVVLANEFFDALAVRRVQVSGGALLELRVGWREARFVESPAPGPASELEEYFRVYGIPLQEGQVAEAGLEALGWVDRMARVVGNGYWIVIDYGEIAEKLYTPDRRRGTLRGFRGHQLAEDPLADVGEQDLTAHVNFTALRMRSLELGLRAAPLRTQTEFLLALGILERVEERALGADGEVASWRERLQAKELFAPGGMGEAFRVLILARGTPLEGLRGLEAPWRTETPPP
jgi:SAM-dependent MidA family methyltransferase